jgi:uncharacterized membrane protein YphA (DoxX/SURF4 family)
VKEIPLAASRRYYPGFLGAFFLVLLRLAIGWHFATEGIYKIMSTPEGKNSFLARIFPPTEGPTFTSEDYLRNSTGPFAERFRQMIPDSESRDKLNAGRLKDEWMSEMHRIGQHFGFDEEQREEAEKLYKAKAQLADEYLGDKETQGKVSKYFDDIAAIAAVDRNPEAMSFERERADDARRRIEYDRKQLVKPLLDWEKELSDGIVKLAKPEQLEREGSYSPPLDELDKIDRMTMYGTTAVGFGLMLGFLTPLAGLGGAAFLALIYLSMPPLPGLPLGPKAEGHYLFVNKNLIELFACMVIAFTPSGMWFGIDAFLFGWVGRIGKGRGSEPEPTDAEASRNAHAKR